MQEAVRNFAERKTVDRSAQAGDEVELNYEGKDSDGLVQMAGKQEAFVLGAGILFLNLNKLYWLTKWAKKSPPPVMCQQTFYSCAQRKNLGTQSKPTSSQRTPLPQWTMPGGESIRKEKRTDLAQVLKKSLNFNEKIA
jgi:hypothetical protein